MGCGFTAITVSFAFLSGDASSSSMKTEDYIISKKNCLRSFLMRGRIFGTWKDASDSTCTTEETRVSVLLVFVFSGVKSGKARCLVLDLVAGIKC